MGACIPQHMRMQAEGPRPADRLSQTQQTNYRHLAAHPLGLCCKTFRVMRQESVQKSA